MLPLRDYINQRKISLVVNLRNDSMVIKQAIDDEMIAILNFYDCSLNCGFNLLKCNMWKKLKLARFCIILFHFYVCLVCLLVF